MVDIKLLKKHLPEDLWEIASSYDIPEDFLVETPEIIENILRSKSIDTEEEKQNWFNLLPLMNDDQMDRLKDILQREKQKLQEIEDNYNKKKMDIKKKYLLKWQKVGYFKKVDEIHKNEEVDRSKEEEEAEQLLETL